MTTQHKYLKIYKCMAFICRMKKNTDTATKSQFITICWHHKSCFNSRYSTIKQNLTQTYKYSPKFQIPQKVDFHITAFQQYMLWSRDFFFASFFLVMGTSGRENKRRLQTMMFFFTLWHPSLNSQPQVFRFFV